MADYEEEENEESDSASFVDQNKELMYRMRLALEADVATESIYHDLDDDAFKAEKRELRRVKANCENEAEYETWKDAFLSREYKKLEGKKFLVCTYIFAGIDQYDMVIPEEEKDAFLCWIDGNGGAFFGGDREATEEEVKNYIALHASDEI